MWNGEYGLKLSGYFSMFDLSLYGFYGWDDMPFVGPSTPSTGSGTAETAGTPGVFVGKYKRMTMLGLDAEIPVKAVVLRTEAAFFPQRYFSIDEQRNELSALAGLDWMPSSWTLTTQYFCDYVFGNMDNLDRKDAYTHGAYKDFSSIYINVKFSI